MIHYKLKRKQKDYGKTRTQQQFKDDCDINVIIKRAQKTGVLPMTQQNLQYGDFTNLTDYQTSLNKVIEAQHKFEKLPSDVREKFLNNPGLFVEFASKPENEEQLIKMGLLQKKEVVLQTQDPTKPKDIVKEPKNVSEPQ